LFDLRRRFTQGPGRIACLFCLAQNPRIEIDSLYRHGPGRISDCFLRHDGERISFLAGGASGRQKAQSSPTRARPHTLRQHNLGKRAELIVVPKEIGLADGQFLGQGREFAARRFVFELRQITCRGAGKAIEPPLQHLSQEGDFCILEVQADLFNDGGPESL
jgi:hypothetical protein